MNTVIIINLNGNAFHLEEPGFQSLRAYLERAQAQLKDNPDKAEIMADLEQAIADKCGRFLQPHKNVHLLIQALALLKAEGRRLRLAVIGEGPERVVASLGRPDGPEAQLFGAPRVGR